MKSTPQVKLDANEKINNYDALVTSLMHMCERAV